MHTQDELLAQLAQAKAQIAALQATQAKAQKLTLRVAQSGGMSMYGVNGKYPVTLYLPGWARLIEAVKSGQIEAFIAANQPLFSTGKDDPRFAKSA